MDKNIFGWETNHQGPVPQIMQPRSKRFADDVIVTGGRSSGKTAMWHAAIAMTHDKFMEYLKENYKHLGFEYQLKPWPSKETTCTKCQAAPIYENHMCFKCETEHVAWLKQPFDKYRSTATIQPPDEHINIVLSDNEIEALINGEGVSRRVDKNTVINIRQSYIKDALQPIIYRDNKVVNTRTHTPLNKQLADVMKESMLSDSMFRGGAQ